jgi:uncharacterized membrane protein YsdA (DUF1294 family)/cold shock CspA family protein
MKFKGTLTQWNDDRGFGFIKPTGGGQDIFAHIKSFEGQTARPQVGQTVTFEVNTGADGKKRARRILPAHFSDRSPAKKPNLMDGSSFLAIIIFVILFAVTVMFWRVPGWVPILYAAASFICFSAYQADKSAAVRGRWRTSESTLHFLAVIGGWPGAIVAQQLLRHKTTKASFRVTFWVTVAGNIAMFLLLCSPLGHGLLPSVLMRR